MGCDGGTIPKRDELVRLKKKPEQKDKDMDLVAKWCLCAISQEPLVQPIMACELGRLYNKESVLEYLLDKSTSENAQHIRNLKDVKVLQLTDNPAYGDGQGADKGDAYIDRQKSRYICPVSGLEMNGRHRFCYLTKCGCVFSERALKEVKSDVCHKCGVAYIPGEEIILNGSEEEVDVLREKMEERRAKAKAEKKAKKAAKHKLAADQASTSSSADKASTSSASQDIPSTSAGPKPNKLPRKEGEPSTSKGTSNGDTKMTNGKSKLSNGSSTSASGEKKLTYDVKKSQAYKSLFFDKEKEKKKDQPHWVTYNPYYN